MQGNDALVNGRMSRRRLLVMSVQVAGAGLVTGLLGACGQQTPAAAPKPTEAAKPAAPAAATAPGGSRQASGSCQASRSGGGSPGHQAGRRGGWHAAGRALRQMSWWSGPAGARRRGGAPRRQGRTRRFRGPGRAGTGHPSGAEAAAATWSQRCGCASAPGLLRLGTRGAIRYRPSVTTGGVRRALGSETLTARRNLEAVAYGGQPAAPPDVGPRPRARVAARPRTRETRMTTRTRRVWIVVGVVVGVVVVLNLLARGLDRAVSGNEPGGVRRGSCIYTTGAD